MITEERIVLYIVLFFDVKNGFRSEVHLSEEDAIDRRGYGDYVTHTRIELPFLMWEEYVNGGDSE